VPEAFANGYALGEILQRVGANVDGVSFPASFVDSDVDDSAAAALRNWQAVLPGLKRLRVECTAKTTRSVLTQVSGAAVELVLLIKQSADRGGFDAPAWASRKRATSPVSINGSGGGGSGAIEGGGHNSSRVRGAAPSTDELSERRFVEEMLRAPTERTKADLALLRNFRRNEVRDEVEAAERDAAALEKRRVAARRRHSGAIAARSRERARKDGVTLGIVERWKQTQQVKQERERKELGLELTQAEITRRKKEIANLRSQRDAALSIAAFEINVKQFVKFEKDDAEDAAGELGSLIGPLVTNSKGASEFKKETLTHRKKRVAQEYQKAQKKMKNEVAEYNEALHVRAIQLREAAAAKARNQLEADTSQNKRRDHAAVATAAHGELGVLEESARIERSAARQRWLARSAAAAAEHARSHTAPRAPLLPSSSDGDSAAALPSSVRLRELRALSPKAQAGLEMRAARFHAESAAAVDDVVEGIFLIVCVNIDAVEERVAALRVKEEKGAKTKRLRGVMRRATGFHTALQSGMKKTKEAQKMAEFSGAQARLDAGAGGGVVLDMSPANRVRAEQTRAKKEARRTAAIVERCLNHGAEVVRQREVAARLRKDPQTRLDATLEMAMRNDYLEGRPWSTASRGGEVSSRSSSPFVLPRAASAGAGPCSVEWLNLRPAADACASRRASLSKSPQASSPRRDASANFDDIDCEGVVSGAASFLQVLSDWDENHIPLAGPVGCIVAFPPLPGHNYEHNQHLTEKYSLVEVSVVTVIDDAMEYIGAAHHEHGLVENTDLQVLLAIEPAYGAALLEVARAAVVAKTTASEGEMPFTQLAETPAVINALAVRVMIAEAQALDYVHKHDGIVHERAVLAEVERPDPLRVKQLKLAAETLEVAGRRGWLWETGPESAAEGSVFDAAISRAYANGLITVGDGTAEGIPVGAAVEEALRLRMGQLVDVSLWESSADLYDDSDERIVYRIDPLTGDFDVAKGDEGDVPDAAAKGEASPNSSPTGSTPVPSATSVTADGANAAMGVAEIAAALLGDARLPMIEISKELWNARLDKWRALEGELVEWHSSEIKSYTESGGTPATAEAEKFTRWLVRGSEVLPQAPPEFDEPEEEDLMALIDERVRQKLIRNGVNTCPDVRVALKQRMIKLGKRLNFAANKAVPSEPEIFEDMMDQIAKCVIVATTVTLEFGLPPVHLMIGGHADVPTKNASKPSIIALTAARANRCVSELEERGIVDLFRSVIHYEGYGGMRPLPGVIVGEGDRPNMRVEINVVDLEEVDPEAARIEKEKAAATQEKNRIRREKELAKQKAHADREKERHLKRVAVETSRRIAESSTYIIEAAARSVIRLKEEEDKAEKTADLQLQVVAKSAKAKAQSKKRKPHDSPRERHDRLSPSPVQVDVEAGEPHSYVSEDEYRMALGACAAAQMRRATLDKATAQIRRDRKRIASSAKVITLVARLPDSVAVRRRYAATILQHAFLVFISIKHVEKQAAFIAASPATAPWACSARSLWIYWENSRKRYEIDLNAALALTENSLSTIVEHNASIETRFNDIVYGPSGFRKTIAAVMDESEAVLSRLGITVEFEGGVVEVKSRGEGGVRGVGMQRRIAAVRAVRHTMEETMWSTVSTSMRKASDYIADEFGNGERVFNRGVKLLVDALKHVVVAEKRRYDCIPVLLAAMCDINEHCGSETDTSLRTYPPFDDAGRFQALHDEVDAALRPPPTKGKGVVHAEVWLLLKPLVDSVSELLEDEVRCVHRLKMASDNSKSKSSLRQARLLSIEVRCLVRRLRAATTSAARALSKIRAERAPLRAVLNARLLAAVKVGDQQLRDALAPLRNFEAEENAPSRVLLSLPCKPLLRVSTPAQMAAVDRETLFALVEAFRTAVQHGFAGPTRRGIRSAFISDSEATSPPPATLLPWRYFVAALAHGWAAAGEWLLSAAARSSSEVVLQKELCERLDPLCAVDGCVDWVNFVNALAVSAKLVRVASIVELDLLCAAYNELASEQAYESTPNNWARMQPLSPGEFASVELPFAGAHSVWFVQLQLQMLCVDPTGADLDTKLRAATFSPT
jgi:hypothetical protein